MIQRGGGPGRRIWDGNTHTGLTEDKDVVECLLCGKVAHSVIKRMKQQLLGGYGDVLICKKSSEIKNASMVG
jgi:hypothetical protein